MMRQITSFSIDWYHCGLCSALDKVHEKTTLYWRKNRIKIEQYNGLNELIGKDEWCIPHDSMHDFFTSLNVDLANKWKNDYSVAVCDGSQWEMRLRYSDHTVKRIIGTVEKPDEGSRIEKMIRDMLSQEKHLEEPLLFGC